MASPGKGWGPTVQQMYGGDTAALAHLLDCIREAVIVFDGEWRFRYVNRAAAELFGAPAAAMLGNVVSVLFPHTRDGVFCTQLHEAATDRKQRHFEAHDPHHDRWLEADAHPSDDGVTVIIRNITTEKRRALAIRDRDERLRLALSFGNMGVWEYDLKTGVVRWSPELEAMHGLAVGQFDGKPATILAQVHPEDVTGLKAAYQAAIKNQVALAHEFRIIWPDGATHFLHSRGRLIRGDQGDPGILLGITQEITDQKHAEAALRESEERFRRVFEEGPIGLALVDKNYHFLKVNGALCRMVGYSEVELLQMSFPDITHPDDLRANLELADKIFKREIPFYQLQKRYVRKNGEIIWVKLTAATLYDQSGAGLYSLGMIEDITELKRTQEEALARQKLQSLGILASGIAHDFNNLLGGILAQVELLESTLPLAASPAEEISRIKQSAIRGAEIVREMMIYCGQEKGNLAETVDISLLVREMLELLKISISKHAILTTDLQENLSCLGCNAAQIRQVVMNLVINASEAIGEKAGVIRITTARSSPPKPLSLNRATDLPPGDYVLLEVSDTGCGMTEAVKVKVFDPFFTTKFAGRGLGLAVVEGIVRAHSGAINLTSAPGKGTRFQVFLRSAQAGAAEVRGPIISAAAEQSNIRAGSILIVEDEEILRFALSKVLRTGGFSVEEASNGSAAMNLLRTHKDIIDVVLLDATLPGTSSREVFEEAQRMRPDLQVIVTSAYDKETVDASFAGLRVDHFIRKPFQLGEIKHLIGNVLSASRLLKEAQTGRGTYSLKASRRPPGPASRFFVTKSGPCVKNRMRSTERRPHVAKIPYLLKMGLSPAEHRCSEK